MKSVGICGHFGGNEKFFDGQTIKTKIIYKELCDKLGVNKVSKLDSFNWKKHPFDLLRKTILLIKENENIIIMPGQNGLKAFVTIFYILNIIYKNRLHYIVIGGWLPEFLIKHPLLIKMLKKYDSIYVETQSMIDALSKISINNVFLLPNCKDLKILSQNDLIYHYREPFPLCTFSRVMKEKGIEEAIKTVETINRNTGRVVYTLDIYGQIDSNQTKWFEKLKKDFPDFINYKGVVPFDESVEVLKKYFVLLFPTYYEGEGFAGTLIDALASGTPVVASNWKYNAEIISNNVGYIFNDNNEFYDCLINLYRHPESIRNKKISCIKKASEYQPANTIKVLLENFK